VDARGLVCVRATYPTPSPHREQVNRAGIYDAKCRRRRREGMDARGMYERYTSLDRGWRACLLATAIVLVESALVSV
jgi:hypothetical protein